MNDKKEKKQQIKKVCMMTIIIGFSFIFLFIILFLIGLYDAKLCLTLIIMVVITCVIYLGLCIKN